MPSDLENRLHKRGQSKGLSATSVDAKLNYELEGFVRAIKDVLKAKHSVPEFLLKDIEEWLVNSDELKILIIDYVEYREKKRLNGHGKKKSNR